MCVCHSCTVKNQNAARMSILGRLTESMEQLCVIRQQWCASCRTCASACAAARAEGRMAATHACANTCTAFASGCPSIIPCPRCCCSTPAVHLTASVVPGPPLLCPSLCAAPVGLLLGSGLVQSVEQVGTQAGTAGALVAVCLPLPSRWCCLTGGGPQPKYDTRSAYKDSTEEGQGSQYGIASGMKRFAVYA